MSIAQLEIKISVKIKKGLENSKQLIVSSHERSGTHYLMNSIDFSFDHYSSKNFINLDYSPLGSIVNFHSPTSLSKFFDNLYLNKNLSIIKNHFHANFFNKINDDTKNKIHFIYIYRNFIDCLKSFWIYLNGTSIFEGPKINIFSKFCFSEPIGQLTRYNYQHCKNFIERYIYNLNSWIEFSKKNKVLFINFENFKEDHTNNIKKISNFIDKNIGKSTVYKRVDYFEVKSNKSEELNFDKENIYKIIDAFKSILEQNNIENKIFEDVIKN